MKKYTYMKVKEDLASKGVFLTREFADRDADQPRNATTFHVHYNPVGYRTTDLEDAYNTGLAMARQLRIAPPAPIDPFAQEGSEQVAIAVARVLECANALGVENTLIALCTILSREGKPFGQRLSLALSRFFSVAQEVDKERYSA